MNFQKKIIRIFETGDYYVRKSDYLYAIQFKGNTAKFSIAVTSKTFLKKELTGELFKSYTVFEEGKEIARRG